VSKLLGFDFTVEYRKGRENKAADALSRMEWPETNLETHQQSEDIDADDQITSMTAGNMITQAISTLQPAWTRELTVSYAGDQQLIQQFQQGELDQEKYQLHNGLLFYKRRIHLGNLKDFQQQVLQQFHSSPLAGHMGTQKTYSRLKKEFYWPGMRQRVREFIRECDICQRNKTENIHPAGLLQPLPISNQHGIEVSMDFIEGLPVSQGKDVILVVVDRLSKYAHFIPLNHPYTANSVAKLFLDHIFKLHGLPNSIVSDRDPVFTSLWSSSEQQAQSC
jgi:hypothetical protein